MVRKEHEESILDFLLVISIVIFILLLGTLGCSCGSKHKSQVVLPSNILSNTAAFYAAYMEIDNDGFIMTDQCDSLLFTSLANPTATLEAAEYTSGQWMRRPMTYPDCYSTGSSRSDISRDMLLGVIYSSYITSNLDRVLRLWKYGESNNWGMSKHGSLHAIYGPEDIALLAQVIYVLSEGENNYSARHVNLPMRYSEFGYVRHLQAIQLWLKDHVYGDISSLDINLLEKYKDESPNNPLFPMVLGYHPVATKLLMQYPQDRLPTSADWCEAWPIQRLDSDKNLQPCPEEGKIHSGGELIFIARHIKE